MAQMKRLLVLSTLALTPLLPLASCATTDGQGSSGTAEDPTRGATAPAKVRYLETNLDAWPRRMRS